MVMLISSTDDLAGVIGPVGAKHSGVVLVIRRMRIRFRDDCHEIRNFALFSFCSQAPRRLAGAQGGSRKSPVMVRRSPTGRWIRGRSFERSQVGTASRCCESAKAWIRRWGSSGRRCPRFTLSRRFEWGNPSPVMRSRDYGYARSARGGPASHVGNAAAAESSCRPNESSSALRSGAVSRSARPGVSKSISRARSKLK